MCRHLLKNVTFADPAHLHACKRTHTYNTHGIHTTHTHTHSHTHTHTHTNTHTHTRTCTCKHILISARTYA